MVTLWLLSTDNLNRPADELAPLLEIIGDAVESLAEQQRWRLHPVGALDLLPAVDRRAAQGGRGVHPRRRRDARQHRRRVRRPPRDRRRRTLPAAASTPAEGTTLEELAEIIDVEHIAEHLYTKGQPDPDLVIRTSGEQRLGGFLLWQSAQSEFYFCEAYWPDFRRVDFLRAVRAYAAARAPLRRLRPAVQTVWTSPALHPAVGRVAPDRPRPAAYFRDIGEWGSSPYREARIFVSTIHDCTGELQRPAGRDWGPALRPRARSRSVSN